MNSISLLLDSLLKPASDARFVPVDVARLHDARHGAHPPISLRALARLTGLNEMSIHAIVRRGTARRRNVRKIARALGIRVSELRPKAKEHEHGDSRENRSTATR